MPHPHISPYRLQRYFSQLFVPSLIVVKIFEGFVTTQPPRFRLSCVYKFFFFFGVVVNTQAHNCIMKEPNFPNAIPLNRYKTLQHLGVFLLAYARLIKYDTKGYLYVVYMRSASPRTALARLANSLWLTTFVFPRSPEIGRASLKNSQEIWAPYFLNIIIKQSHICVQVFSERKLCSSNEILRKTLKTAILLTKINLTKNLTERLDLFKEGWPYSHINKNKSDKEFK